VIFTHASVATPLGPMYALASDTALCVLEFDGCGRHERLERRLKRWFPPHSIQDGDSPVIARLKA